MQSAVNTCCTKVNQIHYFPYLTEIQLYDHSLSSMLYRSVFDMCSHFVALVNLCEGDFIQKYFSCLQAIFLCIYEDRILRGNLKEC